MNISKAPQGVSDNQIMQWLSVVVHVKDTQDTIGIYSK